MSKDTKGDFHCDFCYKSQHEVAVLVTGSDVAICDVCIDVAKELVVKQKEGASAQLSLPL